MIPGAEAHLPPEFAGPARTAAQTAASAAVAAKLSVVAPWMVHLECFASAGWGRVRLFVQGLALEARPGKQRPYFARPKGMKTLS